MGLVGESFGTMQRSVLVDFTTEFVLGIYVLGACAFLQIGRLKTTLFGVLYYGHK